MRISNIKFQFQINARSQTTAPVPGKNARGVYLKFDHVYPAFNRENTVSLYASLLIVIYRSMVEANRFSCPNYEN